MRSCRVGEAPDVDFEVLGAGKEETLVVLESVRAGFWEEEESVGEERAEVEETDDEVDLRPRRPLAVAPTEERRRWRG